MTETIVFKKSLSIASVTLLQAVFPPATAVVCLYVICRLLEIEFSRGFVVLAVLAAALTTVLVRPPRDANVSLLPGRAMIVWNVLVRWSIVFCLLMIVGYALKASEDFSRRVILSWAVTTPLFLVAGMLTFHELMRHLRADPENTRKVVFAGCNEASVSLAARIQDNPNLAMSVTGFFDDRDKKRLGINGNVELIGRLPELAAFVKRESINVIFIALPMRHVQRVLDLLDDLRDTTASIYYVPDVFVFDLIQARTGEILGMPVIAMCETPFYGYRGVIKRVTDLVVAFAAFLVLLPLLILICIAVKLSSPGPAIFKQRRYGLDGEEINIYKFRTMTVAEDGNKITQATREDRRVTPLGRILRRFSLDELPQLINVLQGRMSLVGPRPHAIAHNEEYRKLIKGYMVRHKVLPGITGLAQINGCRGETARIEDMQARLNYDLDYLRNWSLMLDLQIIGKTALKMFRDDKAY